MQELLRSGNWTIGTCAAVALPSTHGLHEAFCDSVAFTERTVLPPERSERLSVVLAALAGRPDMQVPVVGKIGEHWR